MIQNSSLLYRPVIANHICKAIFYLSGNPSHCLLFFFEHVSPYYKKKQIQRKYYFILLILTLLKLIYHSIRPILLVGFKNDRFLSTWTQSRSFLKLISAIRLKVFNNVYSFKDFRHPLYLYVNLCLSAFVVGTMSCIGIRVMNTFVHLRAMLQSSGWNESLCRNFYIDFSTIPFGL